MNVEVTTQTVIILKLMVKQMICQWNLVLATWLSMSVQQLLGKLFT